MTYNSSTDTLLKIDDVEIDNILVDKKGSEVASPATLMAPDGGIKVISLIPLGNEFPVDMINYNVKGVVTTPTTLNTLSAKPSSELIKLGTSFDINVIEYNLPGVTTSGVTLNTVSAKPAISLIRIDKIETASSVETQVQYWS